MTTTGLVLAGGESTRFGGPKPLALFEGQPMVGRICDILRGRCDELIVSVATADDAHAILAAVPGVRTVLDRTRGRGPIEGLRRGFEAAQGDLILVAPSDAPLLRLSLYDELLRVLGDHDAAVPRHEAMDPIRAVYRREAVARVLHDRGIESPSALVDRLDAVYLEGDALRRADPGLVSFIDVNHREDLEKALRIATRPPEPGAAGHRY
jgi:molybdopterin-guanine dinucleotide biosynthesis protein A